MRFIKNPDYAEGMATSIHAGIHAVADGTSAVMICLSDLPLVEAEELSRLLEAFREAAAQGRKSLAVPTFQGQRGNPVLFSLAYKQEILHVRGAVGQCKGLIQRYPEQVLEVEMETDHILRDIDTMEAYLHMVEEAAGAAEAPKTTQPLAAVEAG